MRLSCTVFEILSLIFQKLKRSRDSDHSPSFVVRMLALAMFKKHTKFEVSRIICKEEMKATPNVKILVLSHPLGT